MKKMSVLQRIRNKSYHHQSPKVNKFQEYRNPKALRKLGKPRLIERLKKRPRLKKGKYILRRIYMFKVYICLRLEMCLEMYLDLFAVSYKVYSTI